MTQQLRPAYVNADQSFFDSDALSKVVSFAAACGTEIPTDTGQLMYEANLAGGEGPLAALMGPMKDRGPSTGVIIRRDKLVASWGTPDRADVAFSLTKIFVNALAGIAYRDGLISDLDAPVSASVEADWFSGPHNGSVTWHQLLQLTSEWTGTLFGRPDSIDWHRAVGGAVAILPKGSFREIQVPGSYWEYNDVRINALCAALTILFQEPLPVVLDRNLMRPLGASQTWTWNGFQESDIDWHGRKIQFVPGGSHWGGGMQVSAIDLALIGQLYLRRGIWNGERILPDRWVDISLRPSPLKPEYGFLWWLNTNETFSAFSKGTFWAAGLGGNLLLADPEHELVVVLRWIEAASRDKVLRTIIEVVRA
ncbi:serine hydrolase domain-containing protein [Phyllobacterium chamaecytisi]|uniref:serine hydrolase domain-containing protein n=1 Tax=Phyllobacterium chamaecytisi TaxID=2876082 RepID=UPI001CCA5C49|nr:beta-lactamase family protein [Phyllobacterium sp. KW56]